MRRIPQSAYVDIGSIILPAELAADVQLLLRDPLTNRTRYGELRKLTIRLFANWVDQQRDGAALRPADTLFADAPQ